LIRRSRLPRNKLQDKQLEGGRDWGGVDITACDSSLPPGGPVLKNSFVLTALK